VSAIREGTALYKQVKQSFMEVKSTVEEVVGDARKVRGFWEKLFGAKEKPLAQEKRKKDVYVAVDETKVMTGIVEQLTMFFRLQSQLATHIREEELKSKTVYDPDANLMEAALKRNMAADQMAVLETEIRELMVYGAPKEMGALYSRTFETRDIIEAEQEQARLKEEAQQRYKLWQRREKQRSFQAKSAYLVATTIFLLYLWAWLLLLNRWEKT
jgi:hypothetical protein